MSREALFPLLRSRPGLRLPILLVLALVVLAWGLWSTPILSHNEARRMVVAQEMVRGGSWLLPTMNGELYITKPPLYSWLQAGLAVLSGSTAPWVLRLPSVLAAMGVLLLVWRWGRRHLEEETAFLAALLLLASPLFVFHARFAEIEMLLTLFNSAAVLWYYDYLRSGERKWLRMAWTALGLAVLTKGPVALLFFFPPVLFHALVHDRRALQGLGDPLSWLLFLGTALPWYLRVLGSVDPEVIRGVLQKDIVAKASRSGGAPWYKYLLELLGGFFPWLVIAVAVRRRPEREAESARWLLAAALVPVVIMSFFSAKHGKYILPAFPPLALWVAGGVRAWGVRDRVRRRLVTGGLALMLAGLLVFHGWVAQVIWAHRYQALEPIVSEVRRLGLPLVAVGRTPIQLVYHLGRPVPVRPLDLLVRADAAGESLLVLAESRYWPALDRAGFCVVAEWPVYLKKKRGARLYGTGNACGSAREQVEEHKVPQQ